MRVRKTMNNDFDLNLSLSTDGGSSSDEQPPSPPPTPPPPPSSPALPSANDISVQESFTLLHPSQPPTELPLPNPAVFSNDPALKIYEVDDLPPGVGKSKTIPPPFVWATTRRATVYPLGYLLAFEIRIIYGEVQCKGCERKYEIEYNLAEKFWQVGRYIAVNKNTMHDRAPSVWMNPVLPTCKHCHQENSLKPVMPPKKRSINWLFLWLGQMLGCCTLEQLKYFCKHTEKHRTGAKDRLLYTTYLCLGKQLAPEAPF